MMIKSYKDLTVWERAMEVVSETYKLTEQFPKTEIYGLTSQMRRSAVSIPSNIAEGRRSSSRKEFRQFLTVALGSCYELETQIEIAKMLSFNKEFNYAELNGFLVEVIKMLSRMISNLKSNSLSPNILFPNS